MPSACAIDEIERLEPVRFDLARQPQRPGELGERMPLRLSSTALEHAVGEAGAVPVGLWLVIAIEGQRALDIAASACGISHASLTVHLDRAAVVKPAAGIIGPASRRLRDYGGQLRELAECESHPRSNASVVALTPSLIVAAGWELSAQEAGKRVTEWAADIAELRPPSRLYWEAAAAEQGLPLAAWVVIHAARR